MKKRSFTYLLLSLALCLLLGGCAAPVESGSGTDSTSIPIGQEPEEEEVVRYVYRLAYRDVEFVPDETVQAWREPILRLLENEEYFVGANGEITGSEYPYPDRPGIISGHEIALFDLNCDGVPELLVNAGGGSAGNAFYAVYDIFTGEYYGDLSGGYDNSWCQYFDITVGRFECYGQYQLRFGWTERSCYVRRAILTETESSKELVVYERSYLEVQYNIDAVDLPLTAEQIEAGYDGTWYELYPDATFFVNGSKASLDAYLSEAESFEQTCIRIPETAIKLIPSTGYETPEERVDALLATGQKFLAAQELAEE